MRVLVSALKGTVAVNGNGSPLKVPDSKATARVEVPLLINFGGLGLAASTATLAQMIRRIAKAVDVQRYLRE
jgi:hypothetical protein